MIQVGIFTGYFPDGLEETATKIRKHGFNTVQLDMSFKDMDLETSKISKAKCKKIRDTFRAHNLPVCAVSGYTNIVHPDPAARAHEGLALLNQQVTRESFVLAYDDVFQYIAALAVATFVWFSWVTWQASRRARAEAAAQAAAVAP